jgi:hypothetical protein
MPDWQFIGVEIVVGLAAFVLIMALAVRRGLASTPRYIVRQIHKRGGRFERVVGARGTTWDPSRPFGSGSTRWGRARATYTLGSGDLVHLHYQPANGPAEELEGPIPDTVDRQHRLLMRLLAAHGAVLALGFGVGVAIGHGPAGERLSWGAAGLATAMLLMWLATLLTNIGKALYDVRRQMRTPPTW